MTEDKELVIRESQLNKIILSTAVMAVCFGVVAGYGAMLTYQYLDWAPLFTIISFEADVIMGIVLAFGGFVGGGMYLSHQLDAVPP